MRKSQICRNMCFFTNSLLLVRKNDQTASVIQYGAYNTIKPKKYLLLFAQLIKFSVY